MQNNFESFDNLEVRAQQSSIIQQRAGLVAVYMYKQFIEFHQSTMNTKEVFNGIIENLASLIEYLRQSLNVRNVPIQNVTCNIDSARTLVIVNVLWHTISFTSRFNLSPKALPRKDDGPIFCGRIFAINGDFTKLIKESDDIDTQMGCILENEIASLYVPAEKTRGTIMTIKHKDNKELFISQPDAAREFLLKVIEIVCAGGEYHKQGIKKNLFGSV